MNNDMSNAQQLRVGQRWIWTIPEYEYIIEILNVNPKSVKAVVVQVIGDSVKLKLAGVVVGTLWDNWYWAPRWIYLEGQDRPI